MTKIIDKNGAIKTVIYTEPAVSPNVDIEVNGVSEGTVVAGSTVDVQLFDSVGVVTPVSVTQSGNDLLVELPDGGCLFDVDAEAFIAAAELTSDIEKYAVNNLVVQLKNYGLWTKIVALYPFLGSTASQHKWNLKDPRDLNAAFRLTFFGGWTHSVNGAKPNGSNAYADTHILPSTSLTLISSSYSFYSRENLGTSSFPVSFGCYQSATSSFFSHIRTSGNLYVQETFTTGERIFAGLSDSRGSFIGSRISSTSLRAFRNGVFLGQNTTAQSGASLPTIPIYLSARNNAGVADLFDNKQTAFFSINTGLTDTEIINLNYSIQAFQSTLNRNV